MSELTLRTDVSAFANAVRDYLSDLPADEVDELTDGLEADLLEQAEENDGEFTTTDPEKYAKELRTAAGLPDRSVSDEPRSFSQRYRESLERIRTSFGQFARSTSFGSGITDLLISLRPVWWVLRGWAIATLVIRFMYGSVLIPSALDGMKNQFIGWIVLTVGIIVSIQWGRGRWLPYRWLRVIRTVTSIVAILVAPVLFAINVGSINSANDSDAVSEPMQIGLNLDGEQVTNIFAYDSDGKPLQQVQLFDQDGAPLVTVGRGQTSVTFDSNSGDSSVTIPFTHAQGNLWNVFPLRKAPLNSDGDVNISRAHEPLLPFTSVEPLNTATSGDAKNTTLPSAPTPSPTTP